MTHRIGIIGGDGIGPEVVAEAMKVVDAAQGDLVWTDSALPSSLVTTILLGRCTVGWDR